MKEVIFFHPEILNFEKKVDRSPLDGLNIDLQDRIEPSSRFTASKTRLITRIHPEPMNQKDSPNPQSKIRESIIRQVLKSARDNSDLSFDQQVDEALIITEPLFEQLLASSEAKAGLRPRRKIKHDRKEHVGRFFLRLMEKELRDAKIHDCLIPVFATSVQGLIGDETYHRLAEKIQRLLEFAENKGFNYEQALNSKPGKSVAEEIRDLYRTEAQSPAFEKKIKNLLDKTLVKSYNPNEPGAPLNIEDTINLAYREFIRILKASKPAGKA